MLWLGRSRHNISPVREPRSGWRADVRATLELERLVQLGAAVDLAGGVHAEAAADAATEVAEVRVEVAARPVPAAARQSASRFLRMDIGLSLGETDSALQTDSALAA